MTGLTTDIRYLTRSEIDQDKWDKCICNASNGLIYGRSFYLDAMAENWSALVQGDYQKVMPLTWKKKFGFHYLYQPHFTKTLGVFGTDNLPFEISPFLGAIPGKFSFWDFDLNDNNIVNSGNNKLVFYDRTNYFLPLKEEYENIQLRYRRLAKRMIKKGIENELHIVRGELPSRIIDLYLKDYSIRHRTIPVSDYNRLKQCTHWAFNNYLAKTYLALSPSGEPLAYYIILSDDSYVYSLLGGSNGEGKNKGAFYLVTDAIIRDYSGTEKIFRFEGSDIPGIAFFDELFGPLKIRYQHLVMNNLPFPFNLFK